MRGRPHKQPEVPAHKIVELAAIGCINEEIAEICGFSEDTLTRNFAELLKKGRAEMRVSVRRRQFGIMNGATPQAATMAIWLGKQLLGQKEPREVSGPNGGAVPVQLITSVELPKR